MNEVVPCQQCGSAIAASARFCASCGSPVDRSASGEDAGEEPPRDGAVSPASDVSSTFPASGTDDDSGAQPPRKRRAPFIAVGALVAVAAAVLGVVIAAGGDGESLTVSGTLTLFEADQDGSGSCASISRGYDDVGAGMEITISNPEGDEIGFGELEDGFGVTAREMVEQMPAAELGGDRDKTRLLETIDEFGFANNGCQFDFTIEDVPRGARYYVLASGRRGEQRYTEDELKEPLNITVGDIFNADA